ncbi:hypothetical protein [Nonomuraea glycinis]|uniref:hypothetical protein n=1 Tax=Nonomuraea glycinis TaxID=2047744 RepID=UPI002E0FF6D9|nr:hypothetical protein OHA68_21870 [Nonomuraea glycinis]
MGAHGPAQRLIRRKHIGEREFSAFITATAERELRGQILDDYLADHERRKGPISKRAQDRARQIFDEAFADYAKDD